MQDLIISHVCKISKDKLIVDIKIERYLFVTTNPSTFVSTGSNIKNPIQITCEESWRRPLGNTWMITGKSEGSFTHVLLFTLNLLFPLCI